MFDQLNCDHLRDGLATVLGMVTIQGWDGYSHWNGLGMVSDTYVHKDVISNYQQAELGVPHSRI